MTATSGIVVDPIGVLGQGLASAISDPEVRAPRTLNQTGFREVGWGPGDQRLLRES